MRVGFVGARPSMAMMDSPKSRASGPTDMTAQAYVSLDSLARTCPCKRHPSVSFRGRKTGGDLPEIGWFSSSGRGGVGDGENISGTCSNLTWSFGSALRENIMRWAGLGGELSAR